MDGYRGQVCRSSGLNGCWSVLLSSFQTAICMFAPMALQCSTHCTLPRPMGQLDKLPLERQQTPYAWAEVGIGDPQPRETLRGL
jgi:hypothetical protein